MHFHHQNLTGLALQFNMSFAHQELTELALLFQTISTRSPEFDWIGAAI